MVVTAGAGDRKPEECSCGRLDLFVDDVEDILAVVLGIVRLAADCQESRGDQLVRTLTVVGAGRRSPAICPRTNWL